MFADDLGFFCLKDHVAKEHYELMADANTCISHVNISLSLFSSLHELCSHIKKGGFNLIRWWVPGLFEMDGISEMFF